VVFRHLDGAKFCYPDMTLHPCDFQRIDGHNVFFKRSNTMKKKVSNNFKLGSLSSINFNNKTPSIPQIGWFEIVMYAPSLGKRFKSSSEISNLICKSSIIAF
jgi:hypothetical protein